MATFDKTFPTLDCAACILTPKMVQVGKHPNIKLMPSSEVDEVKGFIGNFHVKIRHKATYFADGVTDALITELAHIQSVRVISRQSVLHLKGSSRKLE